jgi:hypothetical protein
MMRTSWRDWSLMRRVVVVVLTAAVVWDLLALVRLWRDDDDPTVTPARMPSLANVTRRPIDDPQLFSRAVARAPFNSGSSAPPAVQAFVPAPLPVDRPRLTGTVVQGQESFVIVELTDGTMRLVRVGEHASGLTLRTVSPGTATFTDSTGRRIVLRSAQLEVGSRP